MSQVLDSASEFDYIAEYSDDEFLKEQSIENAKDIITELTINNVFVHGEFNDNHWILLDNKEVNIQKFLDFNDIHDNELKDKAKCWILNYLLTIKPRSAESYLRRLKIFLTLTNYLSLVDIDEIESSINSLPSSVRYPTLISGVNFLDYIYGSRPTDSNMELFLNELRLLSPKYLLSSIPRNLPPFKDVVRFSFILTSYAKIWDTKTELKFLPILIWWKLTSVIPMRPSEFCSIKRNCLSIKGNEYFITLPRQKQRATTKNLEVPDTLPVSEEIYTLIKRYSIISEPFGETNTLISAAVYRKTMIQFPSQVRKRIFNSKYFVTYMLKNLLNAFYLEVLYEIYGLEPIMKLKRTNEGNITKKPVIDEEFDEFITEKQIIKIQPNDTRHFSICSMMIQGFNPLTIARMAGHQHLESQYHYQKHIEFFVDSKVYEGILVNRLINTTGADHFHSALAIKNIINRSLAPEKMFKYKEEVEIGYCTDELKRCESRFCILCSKSWIPREEIENNFREIIELKDEFKKKLKIRAETLTRIYKEINVDYKTTRINPVELEDLARESKLTKGEIHDYAMLISKIFD